MNFRKFRKFLNKPKTVGPLPVILDNKQFFDLSKKDNISLISITIFFTHSTVSDNRLFLILIYFFINMTPGELRLPLS